MAILVQFKDNSFDFIPNHELDGLIDSNSIIAFKRASGWVEIGKDAIRKDSSPKRFMGRERRFNYNDGNQNQKFFFLWSPL